MRRVDRLHVINTPPVASGATFAASYCIRPCQQTLYGLQMSPGGCCKTNRVCRSNHSIANSYRCVRFLGEGTYGIVHEAIHLPTGRRVALKQMRIEHRGTCHPIAGLPTAAIRETVLLRELTHPHIVELVDVTHVDDQLFLAFELCDTDLRYYLKQRAMELKKVHPEKKKILTEPFLPVSQIRHLARQIIVGISYCHSRRIMHRDLKPQNLLLNKTGSTLKIADLGLARTFTVGTEPITNEVVTLWYRAPELLLGDQHYTFALDIWSIGCILAEMFMGRPLFYGACETETLFKMFQILGTPIEGSAPSSTTVLDTQDTPQRPEHPVWSRLSRLPYYQAAFPKWKRNPNATLQELIPAATAPFINLLTQLLQYDPSRRPTAEQILKHPWFQETTQ